MGGETECSFAGTGLDAVHTRRAISFCGHAILQDAVFHVADASQDPRFHDNPLVTGAPNSKTRCATWAAMNGRVISIANRWQRPASSSDFC